MRYQCDVNRVPVWIEPSFACAASTIEINHVDHPTGCADNWRTGPNVGFGYDMMTVYDGDLFVGRTRDLSLIDGFLYIPSSNSGDPAAPMRPLGTMQVLDMNQYAAPSHLFKLYASVHEDGAPPYWNSTVLQTSGYFGMNNVLWSVFYVKYLGIVNTKLKGKCYILTGTFIDEVEKWEDSSTMKDQGSHLLNMQYLTNNRSYVHRSSIKDSPDINIEKAKEIINSVILSAWIDYEFLSIFSSYIDIAQYDTYQPAYLRKNSPVRKLVIEEYPIWIEDEDDELPLDISGSCLSHKYYPPSGFAIYSNTKIWGGVIQNCDMTFMDNGSFGNLHLESFIGGIAIFPSPEPFDVTVERTICSLIFCGAGSTGGYDYTGYGGSTRFDYVVEDCTGTDPRVDPSKVAKLSIVLNGKGASLPDKPRWIKLIYKNCTFSDVNAFSNDNVVIVPIDTNNEEFGTYTVLDGFNECLPVEFIINGYDFTVTHDIYDYPVAARLDGTFYSSKGDD